MIIKSIMITGSSVDPRINDDWPSEIRLDSKFDYSNESLESIASSYPKSALWLYEGPEYLDYQKIERILSSGIVVYEQSFYPWDNPSIRLIRESNPVVSDSNSNDHLKEILSEQKMMYGIRALID